MRLLGRGLDLHPLADLLRGAGVRPVATGGDVAVVAATGPLPREEVDPLVGAGTPHLVLSGTGRPGVLRVGPFVVPGQTACLRCVDAHEGERDPRRPLVLEQLAELPAAAVDAGTTALALAWAPATCTRSSPAAARHVVGERRPRRRPAGAPGVGASPALRLRVGRGALLTRSYHHSLSSLPSIARRFSREHTSQYRRCRPFSTEVVQVRAVASSSARRPQKSHVSAMAPA